MRARTSEARPGRITNVAVRVRRKQGCCREGVLEDGGDKSATHPVALQVCLDFRAIVESARAVGSAHDTKYIHPAQRETSISSGGMRNLY